MTTPLAPGIHRMTADTYHGDPCPAPSLSASIAHVLLSSSPAHARWQHPHLNPGGARAHRQVYDLGIAAHGLVLEARTADDFVVVSAKDWKTKTAAMARAKAWLDGKTPVLAHQWTGINAMAVALRAQLEGHEDPPEPLRTGTAEETLIWREGDLWCRARLDWLHTDRRTIDDYKTTGASANPEVWARGPLYNLGHDLQAAFYLRGLRAITGHDATFRFVVQENFPPYATAVIGLGPQALSLATKKVLAALELWRRCLETDTWPAYPMRTCWADLPPWLEARWLERELREDGPMVPTDAITGLHDGDDGQRDIGELLEEGWK